MKKMMDIMLGRIPEQPATQGVKQNTDLRCDARHNLLPTVCLKKYSSRLISQFTRL